MINPAFLKQYSAIKATTINEFINEIYDLYFKNFIEFTEFYEIKQKALNKAPQQLVAHEKNKLMNYLK